MANVSFRVGRPSFPDASNTGPAAGTSFTDTSGELRSTANNQTIQGLRHAGYILVMHNNVIIQDCIINGVAGSIFDIANNGVTVSGTIIRRCRIISGNNLSAIDLYIMNSTEIAFCDLSNCENGITIAVDGVNIHDNYIHDLSRGNPTADAAAHFDGIQGSPGTYTNWTINHNTISSRDTSGIIIGNHTTATQTYLTITNNKFLHNFDLSYGMHIDGVDQLIITGNRISIDNFGAGPGTQRPIYPIDLVSCTNTTVSANVDDASGTVLVPTIS